MQRKIILRFSDYEINTILVHEKIIRTRHRVWWGWWKKKHEPMPSKELAKIARNCPIQVGLVNRMAQKFYSAKCMKVVFNRDGSRRLSPNRQRTPKYYRNSLHPVWFEFSLIEELSCKAFVQRFGRIPEGDLTFFVVTETRGGRTVLKGVSRPSFTTVETIGDSILHLSDLHFGRYHGFTTKLLKDPICKFPLASIITQHVESIRDCRIGVVVISGDITTKGDIKGFEVANTFLESLLKSLSLLKSHVVIVPGNHDIWLKDIKHPTRDYSHEEAFRVFLREFYGPHVNEIEQLCIFRTPKGWNLSFVGLNSVHCISERTVHYGYVGPGRYEEWLKRITKRNSGKNVTELLREKRLNFVVLHHHLLPARLVCEPKGRRPVSLTLDAGQLVSDFQASGIHFALHGHQHVPFVGSTTRARCVRNVWTGYIRPLFVIGGGSSGAKDTRLPEEMKYNVFGIYTPCKNGLHVRMEQFNQILKPQTFMEFEVPFT